MSEITCEEMLDIVLKAGSLILENGGETYRTEQSIIKIATALGAESASAFVTPTVIMFSYTDSNKHYHSAIRRITNRTVNLKKVSQVNDLVRRLVKRGKSSNPRQIANLLDRIQKAPLYPKLLVVIFAAFSSFFFACMFGGSMKEALCALCIGFLLRGMLISLEKLPISSFFVSLLSGGLISILAELCFSLKWIPSSEIVLISVLMQVVPGLAIVNSIRDIIAGDLVSGAARLLDAFMIAAGISVGSVLGILLFSGIIG